MTRTRIDTSYLNRTIAKIMEAAGLTEEAAHYFRFIAHAIISKNRPAWVNGWWHAEDDAPLDCDGHLLVDGGLIELGRPDHGEMSTVSYPVSLTEAGEAMARRVVAYERAIRERGMDADDFAAWQVAVATL